MQGHLRQRGKAGVWYAVFPVNGKQKWHRLQAKTKRDAEKEMVGLIASVNGGTYVEQSKMTVQQYLVDKWVPLVAAKEWAPATIAKFDGNLKRYVFPNLGHVQLQRLTGLHLQELFVGMMAGKFGKPLASQTVRVLHVQLHKALRQAVTWGLIQKNPAEGATVKRGKAAKKRVLTADDTVKLLEALKRTDIYIPVLIIVCTGMRRGEVLGLRWSDVDLDRRRLYVQQALSRVKGETFLREPKTDTSERWVTLPAVLADALRHQRQSQKVRSLAHDLICIAEDGSPLIPTTFSAKFGRYAAAAGFEGATLHGLRHGHASILHEAGIRDKVISERLGHSGIGMTMDVYTHLFQAAQEEAAQKVDKLLKRKKGTR